MPGPTAVPLDEKLFDRIADEELHHLEKALGEIDPDELEVDLASGVLNLTLSGSDQIVINSHRAAGEIWMAAYRKAWHFAPRERDGRWVWSVGDDELRATLAQIIGKKLGRVIPI